MIIIKAPWLMPAETIAFTFWPFIFVRDTELSDNTMNHEKIHGRQQLEMLLILFYLWYYIEYVVRRIQLGTWKEAYYRISFEMEAYNNQSNLSYLKTRKRFEFLFYL